MRIFLEKYTNVQVVQLRLRLIVLSGTQCIHVHISAIACIRRMLKIPNQIVARTFFFYNAEFYER